MPHKSEARIVVAVERRGPSGSVQRGEVIDRTTTSAKVAWSGGPIERVHFDDKDLRFLTTGER